jgi:hypothetical protein
MDTIPRLTRLTIDRFRAFQRLQLDDLTNVNLIVGANTLGKSSLLEALQLYFFQGTRIRIAEVLLAREEFSLQRLRLKPSFLRRDINLAYESLFFGRPTLESTPYFTVGPGLATHPDLKVSFTWLQEVTEEVEGAIRLRTVKVRNRDELPDVIPGLEISFGERQALVSLERLDREVSFRSRTAREAELPVAYLSSLGMNRDEIGRLWDTIALTDDEDIVVGALRAICPSIEKIVLVQSPTERTQRTLMAKLSEFPDPVPLKSLGEGVEHLLSLSLALVRGKGGVVLIDEIENGVHYSIQPALWGLIFQQALKWRIQVFATTHSWDCVEGFQIAASTHNTSASLFRLERAGSGIRAIRFALQEIEIARRESIEVR